MTYDAEDNLLVKKIYDSADLLLRKLDYIGNFEFVDGTLETVHHSQGRLKSEAPNVFHQEYKIADHLGNTRIVYTDANTDGIITADEVIDEYQYYAFGMEQEIYTPTNTTNDYRYRYNGIERVEDLDVDIDMAFYRGLDPTIGRWLQVDPKAEATIGLTPYGAMNQNPVSMSDPNGDVALAAIGIGMAIGAALHTGTHLATNNFSFTNWNWGAFAGSVVAGGVGGGVSPALTIAGIGGFAGGAITGGASGFSQNLTSGLINGNLTAGGLTKSTFLGAGIGGTIQGIGAAFDGRRFWDGAKVEYIPIAEDAGLSHVMQDGANNCTCATGEMGIQAQGGRYTQKDVRSWMGGDPDLNPLPDVNVVKTIKSKTGLNWDGIQNGSMQGYASKSDYITSSLKSGRSVHMTVPGNGNIAHSVSVKGSYFKHVTKVNGSLRTSVAHRIFDPARSNPFYMSANHVNTNAITIFSMWR